MNNLPKSVLDKAKKYHKLNDEQKTKFLEDLYIKRGMSWRNIASVIGTYGNKVRRDAKKLGIKSRDKSEAQALALKTGVHPHPTKGKKQSDSTKEKISEGVAAVWDSLSPQELKQRKNKAKQAWAKRSPEEIDNMKKAAFNGIRRAAKEGSALEKFILESLIEYGYHVEFHKEHWVEREALQIDLFLPDLRVAIEVDGPSHFKNIWGHEHLQKNQQRDNEKTGLLLNRGLCIVRVRQTKKLSQKYKRDILAQLLNTLQKIEEKFPNKGKRHIIIGE